jgi:hypothetical protein
VAISKPVAKNQSAIKVLSKIVSTITLVLAPRKYCTTRQVGST